MSFGEIPEPANGLIERTLLHEILNESGSYTNDPDDPGGETKWGIAKRYHPTVDIKNLTRAGAKAIYYNDYFVRPGIHKLPAWLQPVMFDLAVNPGYPASNKILQRALGVTDDGVIGPHTINIVTRSPREKILRGVAIERLVYYMQRIAERPAKVKYARGWARRSLSYLG